MPAGRAGPFPRPPGQGLRGVWVRAVGLLAAGAAALAAPAASRVLQATGRNAPGTCTAVSVRTE